MYLSDFKIVRILLFFLCISLRSCGALTFSSHKTAAHQNNIFSSRHSTELKSFISDFEGLNDDEDDDNFGNTKNDEMDDFMASLNSRIKEVRESESYLPLVVLDTMLPRQVMRVKVKNNLLIDLVMSQFNDRENPYFGMLGRATLANGKRISLTTGVEVEILEKPVLENKSDGEESIDLVIRAGRRFKIVGDTVSNSNKGGWTEAKVKFLDSEEEESQEISGGASAQFNADGDRMAVARAICKANELTTPNMNMKGNLSLVDRWIELARKNEREPGQIDQLLQDIGEIPPPESPTERAFWIGSLINPLPALGVAMEIRPSLLTAKSAEKRVDIVKDAILKSIRHMDNSARMW